MSTQTNGAKEVVSPADNQKVIDNHKNAAKHLEKAAKHHNDAAQHHEEGNHEEAFESTVKAHGHTVLANNHQDEAAKLHVTKK